MTSSAARVFVLSFMLTLAAIIAGVIIGMAVHAGEADLRLQRELNRSGCDAGEPDGIIGEQTRDAIRCYQRRHGLEVTGEATGRTMRHLFGGEGGGAIVGVFTEKPQCGDFVEASAVYLGQAKATQKAWESWASLVINRDDLGIRYSDPAKAMDKVVECFKARPTDWWTKNCTVKARPCK